MATNYTPSFKVNPNPEGDSVKVGFNKYNSEVDEIFGIMNGFRDLRTTKLTSSDLNTAVTTGSFYCQDCSNAPATNGVMIVTTDTSTKTQQLFIVESTGYVYSRYYNSTTWSAWKSVAKIADEATKLATSRTISLAGKATGSASFDGTANANINVTDVTLANTATALATSRTISLTGKATGSASFDGTANANINVTDVTLANTATAIASAGVSGQVWGIDGVGSQTWVEAPASEDAIKLASDGTAGQVWSMTGAGTQGWASASAEYATTAGKLATARDIALSGKATGSASFDGSSNISINVTDVTLANTATAFATSRNIALTGKASGSASFNGTADANINVTTVTDAGKITSNGTTGQVWGMSSSSTQAWINSTSGADFSFFVPSSYTASPKLKFTTASTITAMEVNVQALNGVNATPTEAFTVGVYVNDSLVYTSPSITVAVTSLTPSISVGANAVLSIRCSLAVVSTGGVSVSFKV